MYNYNGLTVELLTANGNKITEFAHEGKTYVEGRKGSSYKIKITNGTASRIKAIISVDGLDILSGKRASRNSGGYVLNAFETQTFDGWRISDSQVREFFFTKAENSYNAKTGNDTNNLGVIGVLAYKEYTYNYFAHSWNTIDDGRYYRGYGSVGGTPFIGMLQNATETLSAGPVTSAVAASAQNATRSLTKNAVGTGMGKKKDSHVTTVQATWEPTPFATVEIYYKSRKQLEAMGIVVAPIKQQPQPKAFADYCTEV